MDRREARITLLAACLLALACAGLGWTEGLAQSPAEPSQHPAIPRRQIRGTVSRDTTRDESSLPQPGGGFVFNTVHNILPEVPPQNVLAMFEAVEEFNGA